MYQKRIRVSLDFLVSVNDITPDRVLDDVDHYSNKSELVGDPITYQLALKQRNLLHGLLLNKKILNKYIRLRVLSYFEGSQVYSDDLNDRLGVPEQEDENLLQPIIANLQKEDVDFFEIVSRESLFSENTEHFYESFHVDFVNATLTEFPDDLD
jgi:hypothetical protein